ncbi:MAG: hypothetical protein FWB91_01635 [Defluviitaleaceae bacterium]|nr:hypothetical protein [Defluviitaleaceae bacterium]
MDSVKIRQPISITIYLVLIILILVFGFILFIDAFQTVNLAITISFWVCFLAPLAAAGLYALLLMKYYSLGFEGETIDTEPKPAFVWVVIIFVLSSIAMMWYAYPGWRNLGGQWSNRWYLLLFGGIGMLVAIVFIREQWFNKFRKLINAVCCGIIIAFFLFGTFLSANRVLDTSDVVITQHTIVRAERPSASSNRVFVTIADDAGNQTRLMTTSTVFHHSRDNIGGVIYKVSQAGAFNITNNKLAIIGDGPGGIERVRENRR